MTLGAPNTFAQTIITKDETVEYIMMKHRSALVDNLREISPEVYKYCETYE